MERQDTVKFSQGASPNLGSLRLIVAQRTARYEVANKYVASIFNHSHCLEIAVMMKTMLREVC